MAEYTGNINMSDYSYDLPEERIAQHPVKERDQSKLLIYNKGTLSADIFRNIPDHIPPDSLLVFNNAKVINARLLFRKDSGAFIEILCLEPLSPPDYSTSFSSVNPVEWKCIVGNLKKWKGGTLTMPFQYDGQKYLLSAVLEGSAGEAWRIKFYWEAEDLCFGRVIESAGHIPLPPYIKREDKPEDHVRYQTIYSKTEGSVAAPTAGLHFTKEVISNILNKGIKSIELTLHVGAGTFQPVRHNNIREHKMHREHFSISRESVEMLIKNEGRVIAVGTTTVRTLESLYWLGVACSGGPSALEEISVIGQWQPYKDSGQRTCRESLESLLRMMDRNGLPEVHAATELIILPGYNFRTIKGMITNFHQPGSTLLLLVAAFTGEDWKKIYSYAEAGGFRFLSYGDSSILFK